ncbi:BON domain-containing protein [Novilysobacter defluvii]|uniref:Membrane protein n=1 Tax=Lysobacter defluvii IMMIB APB-9 = DSM 18482 TaxID=1385515 RepID=A0A0A0M6Y7_9GAMM|nr:BON domain-containing protein [Lysobacter defluvii]KGO98850.1 membrane protein [Lysobacter defluvii IMMIB APB-9 = DSM 18482]
MTKSRIAIALATGLMFAAGAAMANDPVNDPVDTQAQATQEVQDADAVQDAQVSNTDVLDEMDSDQPVEDTWITTKVKSSLLADTDTSGLQIEVETNNGVVGLSGQLDSQEQVDAAVRIAEGIEGVVEVDASDLNYGTMADYEQ